MSGKEILARTILVVFAVAAVVGGVCVYLGISTSLHAENTLHAILDTVKDVDRFVAAERRWPDSWGELGPYSEDESHDANAWRVESARRQKYMQIDFDSELGEIASLPPEQFKAIYPTGAYYPYTHYGFLHAMLETVKRASDVESNSETHAGSWLPYSEDAKDKSLSEGKSVFVFVYAELNPASHAALEAVDFSKLSLMSGDDDFVTLMHKYDDWNDPTIRSIWKDVGHTKKPFVVHYVTGENPRRLDPSTLKPLVVKYNR